MPNVGIPDVEKRALACRERYVGSEISLQLEEFAHCDDFFLISVHSAKAAEHQKW